MAGQGISGVGIAVTTGGALLVYAGFKGMNPVQALKEISSGAPSPLEAGSYGRAVGKALTDNLVIPSSSGGSSALVTALGRFQGDHYSQLKRWQPGFSDCSSFVGKGLKAIGIKPPGASTTLSYLSSPSWRKISRAEAKAGDLAVNTSHMAVFTDNSNGIGQQNQRRNVSVDTMTNLMSGTGSFTCLRYVGSQSKAV